MTFTQKDGMRILFVCALLVAGGIVYRYYPETVASPSTGIPPPGIDALKTDSASIGTVVTDKETGKEFLSNQIILEFHSDTSDESAAAMIAKYGGVVVAHFTKAPVYLVQVEDAGDGSGAKKSIVQFQKEAQVKKADLNYLTVAPPAEQQTEVAP